MKLVEGSLIKRMMKDGMYFEIPLGLRLLIQSPSRRDVFLVGS
jgi:hypothetical protein